MIVHPSPLLAKAAALGLRVPEDLEKLAIARGLRYYDGRNEMERLRQEPRLQISRERFPMPNWRSRSWDRGR